jgi:hypothetical protein
MGTERKEEIMDNVTILWGGVARALGALFVLHGVQTLFGWQAVDVAAGILLLWFAR